MISTVLDIEKKIKIPQNKEIFFKIEKSNVWSSSIEIRFDLSKELSIDNLFLIIKSYVTEKSFAPFSFCTIIKTNDIIVSQNENIR
jgi:hypothetical protein